MIDVYAIPVDQSPAQTSLEVVEVSIQPASLDLAINSFFAAGHEYERLWAAATRPSMERGSMVDPDQNVSEVFDRRAHAATYAAYILIEAEHMPEPPTVVIDGPDTTELYVALMMGLGRHAERTLPGKRSRREQAFTTLLTNNIQNHTVSPDQNDVQTRKRTGAYRYFTELK
jgi:hypothetical protein